MHARLGDALLDAVRRDQVKREELTAWYADMRERFPTLEMPSQTYASYMEQYGSAAEAGIAWAAAAHRDRFDARNAIGWGRALKRMGKLEPAFARFRDAARLDPTDPWVYGWFSTCHYGKGEYELAELTLGDRHHGEPAPERGRGVRARIRPAQEATLAGSDGPGARADGGWCGVLAA